MSQECPELEDDIVSRKRERSTVSEECLESGEDGEMRMEHPSGVPRFG